MILPTSDEYIEKMELFSSEGNLLVSLEGSELKGGMRRYGVLLEPLIGAYQGLIIAKIHTNKEVHVIRVIRK